MDYRNAIKWYQYDPTKWTIWVMSKFGLASHLKVRAVLCRGSLKWLTISLAGLPRQRSSQGSTYDGTQEASRDSREAFMAQ